MGINLSTGQFAFEVEVGRQLLSEAGRLGRPIKIYSIGNKRVGVVEMMDRVKTIETGNYLGEFDIKRPLNWKDVPGLRLQEIVESEFLMMEDVRAVGWVEYDYDVNIRLARGTGTVQAARLLSPRCRQEWA